MPSRINSTTTSPGGLISTGDSDNNLLIQTGDTTAITINNTQQVSLTNPLGVASGGTGANTAANARTNLGLVIGTDVLAPNGSGASLTSLNASNISSGTVATARLGSGTANSTTFLRGDGTWQQAGGQGGRGQVFTSNGTFTIPSGITSLKVTVVGSGGTGSWTNGAGGGGGGTAIRFLTGLTSGNTLSVTVGARVTTQGGTGGSSTVSSGSQSISTITGGAGQGGAGGGGGASGGNGSGGDINITGQRGQYNIVNIADSLRSSYVGGSSTYGFGGWNSDGTGFGGGGAAYDGNYFNGTSGIVIFEW